MHIRGIVATAGVVLALSCAAGDAQYTGDIDCTNPMTQRDMNICANRDYAKADAELNAAYRTAMARLDEAGKARLRDAERNWIAARDRDCKAATAETEGGSIHPLDLAGCLTEKTRARTRELNAFR
jgi:uncharacterized protein YecT (DUF1311 family)